jgi:hypothetical protein
MAARNAVESRFLETIVLLAPHVASINLDLSDMVYMLVDFADVVNRKYPIGRLKVKSVISGAGASGEGVSLIFKKGGKYVGRGSVEDIGGKGTKFVKDHTTMSGRDKVPKR